MTAAPRLSLALALGGAGANLPAVFAALPPAPDGAYEILVCHAADDPPPSLPPRPDLRPVAGAPGALIPELWRDGILAARGAWVATLTAHCPPRPGWIDRALALIDGPHVAYGGLIALAPGADRVARAIHLLRYAGAAAAGPSPRPGLVRDLSADNALYRRDAILRCPDLLAEGFWEPGFHARFLAWGETMELRPDLVVEHRNRYSARAFLDQRRRHGRVFGRHRARDASGAVRALMLLASPAALPVFAAKRTGRILREPALRAGLADAAPWLYPFMAAWCWGEAQGYADALRAGPGDRR